MMREAPAQRLLWIVPLLAALGAYAIAPWGALVWDDQLVMKDQVLAMRSLGDVFAPPAGIPQWSYAYYRPVTVLSYVLDLRLFGHGAAAGPHVMNVLWHAAATFMLWLLAQRMFRALPNGALASISAAVLFAVHPVHTESVSWITGRSDVLATMLLLGALLLALRSRERAAPGALLASPVVFLLALLAKEVAIAGLVLLPVLWLAAATGGSDGPGSRAPRWGALSALVLCWLAAAGLYWFLRQAAMPPPIAMPASVTEFGWTALQATAFYLMKLVVPWPQSNFVGPDMLPAIAAALAIATMMTALLAWSAWHWRRGGAGSAFLGLWWVIVTIAPSLAATLPGLAETPVAERYLYLPSAGAALAIGAILAGPWAARRAKAIALGTGFVALVALVATLQRGFVWLTDLSLWTDTTAKAPGYALPRIELGRAWYARNDQAAALDHFLKARQLTGSRKSEAVANFNIGLLYLQRGNLPDGTASFEQAIATDPAYARGHYGLGRALHLQSLELAAHGRPATERLAGLDRAMTELDLAIGYAPRLIDAHVALAWVLGAKGDVLSETGAAKEAAAAYRSALERLQTAVDIDASAASRPEVQELARLAERGLRARQGVAPGAP